MYCSEWVEEEAIEVHKRREFEEKGIRERVQKRLSLKETVKNEKGFFKNYLYAKVSELGLEIKFKK